MSETGLSPDQRLRAAFAVLCMGLDQHAVAAIFGVNSGRVSEAVTAAREAFGIKRARTTPNGGQASEPPTKEMFGEAT